MMILCKNHHLVTCMHACIIYKTTFFTPHWHYIPGDLVLFVVLAYKTYLEMATNTLTSLNATDNATIRKQLNGASNYSSFTGELNSSQGLDVVVSKEELYQILPDYLQLPASYNLTDLLFYMVMGILVSELMYHVACGFLQVYYYEMQRDQPEKWKCQPHRFLTRSNELHEVVAGTTNLILSGGNYKAEFPNQSNCMNIDQLSLLA